METVEIILTSDYSTYLGILVALLSTSILWYYWYVHRPYAKFPSYRVEPRLPFWILKRKLLNNVLFQKYIDLSKQYEAEGMFVMWVGVPYLFAYGEEIVKLVLNEPSCIDKPKLYEFFEFAIGKGLLTSNGETWKKQRKLVNPAFHVVALKEHTSVMNENADALVKQLLEFKSQPTDKTIDFLCKYSLKIVFESSFGKDFYRDDGRMEEITMKGAEFIVYRLFCPWLYFDFALHLFPYSRETLRISKEILNLTMQIVEEIKDSFKSQKLSSKGVKSDVDSEFYGRKPKSFCEILVEQHLQDPSFSVTELCHQLMILAGAAFDTTSHSLMWCLFLLGLHQDVQERAYDEVMAETDGDIQYNDLSNLTYLECVIKETLRIYPVAPVFARRVTKDLQCGQFLIPKNATVAIFPYMVHRNPDVYPDPEKFDPERFMAKNSKIKSWHHIPFAEGNRPCIGKNFAMMEIKIILAHILRNFKIISLDRREDVEFKWAVVLDSEKKLRMQFVPRH